MGLSGCKILLNLFSDGDIFNSFHSAIALVCTLLNTNDRNVCFMNDTFNFRSFKPLNKLHGLFCVHLLKSNWDNDSNLTNAISMSVNYFNIPLALQQLAYFVTGGYRKQNDEKLNLKRQEEGSRFYCVCGLCGSV